MCVGVSECVFVGLGLGASVDKHVGVFCVGNQ